MLFADNQNEHDAALNLAMEEYLLRQARTNEDILLFYINAPSIIIGRHQNTIEEINRDYVEEHHIRIVRRLSGGGAVYHDLGNLNFSFITDYRQENFNDFRKFTEPVVRSLNRMGVRAELSGRNDILVDGRKVSGNAQYISRQRMVSHGTLLFNSDLTHVADALKVKANKMESKGIKSVRSRVANIIEFLDKPMDIETFRATLLTDIFEGASTPTQFILSESDRNAIQRLADDRYRSWEWNYGKSPDFNLQKTERFPFGEVTAHLNVQQGQIRAVKFYGDFFAEAEPEELEGLLVDTAYTSDALAEALKDIPIGRYFHGLDLPEFIHFLV